MAGVLQAGQYFGGTIQTKANQIFNNTDWTFFLDRNSDQYFHSYTPGQGFSGLMNRPTDETLLTTLLALARHPNDSDVLQSFFGLKRYELLQEGHHHHVICSKCRKVQDVVLKVDLDAEEHKIQKDTGFKIQSHSLEFFGLCTDCQTSV
jgi:hypothetical protein